MRFKSLFEPKIRKISVLFLTVIISQNCFSQNGSENPLESNSLLLSQLITASLIIILTLLGLLLVLYSKLKGVKKSTASSLNLELMNSLINSISHIVYIVDEDGNIQIANTKARIFFGISSENLRGNTQEQTIYYRDGILNSRINTDKPKEVTCKDHLGQSFDFLLFKQPLDSFIGNSMIDMISAVDITRLKKRQQKIIQLAHYNSLTNLPNRTLLKRRLEKSINQYTEHKKYGVLLYIDLDSFKNVNESQGYVVGDLMIMNLVKRFQKELPEHETIAHLGGDKFIINISALHTKTEIAEILAVQYAEIILENISKPLEVKDISFKLTASIGLVLYPRDGNTEETLFQRAGAALNVAKNNGGNVVQIFDEKLEQKIKSNHVIETEIRNALIQSQFVMFYQPILDVFKSKIVGAEALIRWNHPKRGIISPGEFIDIAEKIHIITEIGNWVLEEVCKKIRQNLDEGKSHFFIAVNVSAIQLKNSDFYYQVSDLIQRYGIPPNYLEMELTESVLMEDVDFSVELLNKFKLLGIKISIDDFGTGYSSFNYLTKLPIDKLKIDQSFVSVLPQDQNSATIVRTIIKMAKELSMNVVAEGIETQEQFSFLKDEGCKFFQGYMIYKPMPFEEFRKLDTSY